MDHYAKDTHLNYEHINFYVDEYLPYEPHIATYVCACKVKY